MFTFDNVFGEDDDNQKVYDTVVKPLVFAAFMKSKVTCFAYGQTGSGKTFTMMGDMGKGKIHGLYLLAANDLFGLRDTKYKDLSVGLPKEGLGFLLRNLLREGLRSVEQTERLFHQSGCQGERTYCGAVREADSQRGVADGADQTGLECRHQFYHSRE